jgi:hypothetical protein
MTNREAIKRIQAKKLFAKAVLAEKPHSASVKLSEK